MKKNFRKHQIQDSDNRIKDSKINYNNLFVSKQQKITDNNFQTNNYYFIENPDKTTSVIWFIKNGKTDKETEEKLVNLIIEDKIPQENYGQMKITSLDFTGRKTELGNTCYWAFLNTVQCPNLGEVNWSIHRTWKTQKMLLKISLILQNQEKVEKLYQRKL